MADEDDGGGVFGDLGASLGDSAADGDTEITSKSWIERLMGAIVGVLIGLVLVILTCVGLFWNEGRAVQTARSLAEGGGLVVDVDERTVDPANEGKLVHVQGELATGAPLADPDLLVEAKAARLLRTVEMFQWKEETRTETRKKLGGGEETVTHYSYTHVWSDRRIDSSHFRRASGHENPQMRYGRFETAARDATLGAFRPGEPALRHLPANELLRVDPDIAEKLRAKPGAGNVQVADGKLYFGDDVANPKIGDLRISYHVAPVGPVSLIGRQAGADIAEYQTKAGDRLLMGAAGLVPAAQMFRQAEQENLIITWLLRVLGVVCMAFGWYLMLRPIAVVGDLVPLIGSVLAAGAGLAAFLITAVMAPVVMAVAWFFYRPLVAVAVLAGGVAIAYGVRLLARNRRVTRPAPTGMPGTPAAAR
jgi:Transmembrane protein 43